MNRTALLTACIVSAFSLSVAAEYTWWEGEAPARGNFPAKNPFQPEDDATSWLSEGAWIGTGSGRTNALTFLEYDIVVATDGEYRFYARKFWKHGPFRWRCGTQAWQEVTRAIPLYDSVRLFEHCPATWIYAGDVSLGAGTNTLRIELTETNGAACFDCFILTTEPFVPCGALRPDDPLPEAPDGWVVCHPEYDPFEESPLDLRAMLNEAEAGAGGFITVQGAAFVHSDTGEPVRFWAVNAGPDVVRMASRDVDHFAQMLARKGVNMVRIHGPIYYQSGPRAGQVDYPYLDQLFYFVTALKKAGIYSLISIYFQHWLDISELAQFPGYAPGTLPFAIHFFHPAYKRMYQSWQQALLTTTNKYSGLPLCDDPAVASIEIINEDSLFFWTFDYARIPAPTMAVLEQQFAKWLTARYGSLEKALISWGTDNAHERDDLEAGRAGFVTLWRIFSERGAREQDTARFLAEIQTEFFKEMYAFIREDCGFKAAVYASNWRTADDRYLEPIDKLCNCAADYIDYHGYFGGARKKASPEHNLAPGDAYDDRSAVLFQSSGGDEGPAFGLPMACITYDGKPVTVSEYAWTRPNRFRAESAFVSSAIASLLGHDAMIMFATHSCPGWMSPIEGYYPIQTPTDMGQFPATALLYRRGLIKEAPPSVEVNLNVENVLQLKGAPVNAVANQDENRAADMPAEALGRVDRLDAIDPRAFYVGQVRMNFTTNAESRRMVDLSQYIDEENKVITSMTGQMRWDYGNGLVTLNAPQVQGALGFLQKAGTVQLPALTIASSNEFASLLLVALDDTPLTSSKRMLLQVMTEQRNHAWSAPGRGLREIEDLGRPPVLVRAFSGAVTLTRDDAQELRVTALDWNGYPVGTWTNATSIALLPDAPYYIVER
jgi:hypothetical protein